MYLLRNLAVVACAIGLAASGGCDDGGSAASGSSDQGAVRAAVLAVSDAFAAGDGNAACGLLARGAREQFAALARSASAKPPSCAAGVELYLEAGQATEDLQPRIDRIEVDGVRATVVAVNDDGVTQRATLHKRDGAWRLTEYFRD